MRNHVQGAGWFVDRVIIQSLEVSEGDVRGRSLGSELVFPCMRSCHPRRFQNNNFAELGSGSEEGSYLRLIGFCITQL